MRIVRCFLMVNEFRCEVIVRCFLMVNEFLGVLLFNGHCSLFFFNGQ